MPDQERGRPIAGPVLVSIENSHAVKYYHLVFGYYILKAKTQGCMEIVGDAGVVLIFPFSGSTDQDLRESREYR
jgi:hypothetical protein